ncbi:LpqB family beta-propeller domain-containing protein [Haladaptatus sp. NG-SE-30]
MPLDFAVEDALDLAYVSEHAWNADDSRLGYLRYERGETKLAVCDVPNAEETDLSPGGDRRLIGEDVSEFAWRPDHPTEAAFVADGAIRLFDYDTGETDETSVVASGGDHSSLAWHPAGDVLAYLRNETLWLHDLDDGSVRAIETNVADLFSGTPVRWSPDGRYLATMVASEHGTLGLAVFEAGRVGDEDESNEVAWTREPTPAEERAVSSFTWVGDDHLVYAEDATDGTARTYRSVRPGEDDSGVPILTESDDRVLAHDQPVGNDYGQFALYSGRTGFHHCYVVDAEARRGSGETSFESEGITQVTAGGFEARGDAPDVPAWSDDGTRVAVVTNEHDPGERRLHVATIEDSAVADTTAFEFDGNALRPTWASDGDHIAVIRAGRRTPADVHVANRKTGSLVRVSSAYPNGEKLDAFPDPEPISFTGTGDTTVHGYCYAPPDAEPGDDLPAVVWCHGGPIRQMRRGFHHMRSYAFFHVFNHVLVSKGYVVLELNYRGGIGYGREFEHGIHHAIGRDDVADSVDAAAFLRDHELVGDQVGLWGLSYGGFLANAVATQTEAFDCAVNFAGIWDWRPWVEYVADMYWGAGRRFIAKFDGMPDDDGAKEHYAAGSPADHYDGLDTPLFALHGTDDPNVPFEQMDLLVDALVTGGDEFEMAHYPGEDHMFEQATTWQDALSRVLPFLESHLE